MIFRSILRAKRENYPPPPIDASAADEFMKSDSYKDKTFAAFYQGVVTDDSGESGLVFAHPGNVAKLDEETKTIQCDGTFRTGSLT